MAVVGLICMTMTCVTLTSCGDDDDSEQSEITCEYGIITQITKYLYSGENGEGDSWNKAVNDTNEKVRAILAKYSTTWNVKATTSTVQQVLATNDAETKQKVEDMKAELNKVFADLESLKSTYPDDFILYTIYVVAMHDAPINGSPNTTSFFKEDITLSYGTNK